MQRESLTIAQGQLRLVDPHSWTDVREAKGVQDAIFDALIARWRDLKFVPALAESWEVSPDARVWTFHLREGVSFHNGEAFDSEAVKYSLDRAIRPEVNIAQGIPSVFCMYLQGARVEPLGRHTVRIITQSPIANLLDILVDLYVVPPRAAESMGAEFKTSPIGTGAYRFTEWAPEDRIVAEANASYFQGAPDTSRVVWKLVPDPRKRLEELASGRADIACAVHPKEMVQGGAARGIHLVRIPGLVSVAFFFNCSSGTFREKKVRQAANYAVDKTKIIDCLLGGAGDVLSGFVSPRHFGYDGTVKPYPYDPRKATELLAEAGYANGLAITILTPRSFPNAEAQAEIVAQQLAEVGIVADLRIVVDRWEYISATREKQIYDACWFDSSPVSTYRILREKISSKFRGAWWQGYANAEVDGLIDLGDQTVDENRREGLYKRCFRIIHDDAPWLFLYNEEVIFGVSEKLGGWRPRADGCIIVRSI
jgi:peptide/nickel transport system substrate-binding protein